MHGLRGNVLFSTDRPYRHPSVSANRRLGHVAFVQSNLLLKTWTYFFGRPPARVPALFACVCGVCWGGRSWQLARQQDCGQSIEVFSSRLNVIVIAVKQLS